MTTCYIRRWFRELGIEDVPLAGGKNASLGEMYRELTPKGGRVPNGFAVTAGACRHLLDSARAWTTLHQALDDLEDLARRGAEARRIVCEAGLPADLEGEILVAYRELQAEYGEGLSLAAHSLATA